MPAASLAQTSWDDVRILLAALRAKNLHGAATRLGIDASTVSRRISSLEEGLATRLFTRSRDGLRPTTAAEKLLAHAERVEAELNAMLIALRSGTTRATGLVRIAATEALGRMLVAEGLPKVRDEHPDLEIELLTGNAPADLARGEADVAVRLAPLKQPSLRARCVAEMGIGLFAAPSYLRARGTPRTSAQLRAHDVLLPTGELARLPEAKWLQALPATRVALRSNSMPALVEAATRGLGLAPLPLGWGDSEPALTRVMVMDDVAKRKVWLVTHESGQARPAVRIVVDALSAICERVFKSR